MLASTCLYSLYAWLLLVATVEWRRAVIQYFPKRSCKFLPLRVAFSLVYEISREPLNRFAPNSHEKHVWSLAWMSLNIQVKGRR